MDQDRRPLEPLRFLAWEGLAKAPGSLAPPCLATEQEAIVTRAIAIKRRAPAWTPAPQLAGLFAGGMPKLRKTGGGVDTECTLSFYALSLPWAGCVFWLSYVSDSAASKPRCILSIGS